MHPNPRACAPQQNRVRHCANNSDAYAFFNLLTSPELLNQVESLLPEHRERLFPPTETLSMFLSQALSADRSCRRAVNEVAVKRLIGGLPRASTHTGAYCRARRGVRGFMSLDCVACIFGPKGCMVVDHVNRLPERLPMPDAGLTR